MLSSLPETPAATTTFYFATELIYYYATYSVPISMSSLTTAGIIIFWLAIAQRIFDYSFEFLPHMYMNLGLSKNAIKFFFCSSVTLWRNWTKVSKSDSNADCMQCYFKLIGSVKKLLGLISKEKRIKIDEVTINPPLQSKEHVSIIIWLYRSCVIP